MDSARLGRVLGQGARGAAKTLIAAVDAASAPSARPAETAGSVRPAVASRPAPTEAARERGGRAGCDAASGGPQAQTSATAAARAADQHTNPARTRVTTPAAGFSGPDRATSGFAEGSRRFRSAVAQPVRRLSGVLWLEFTGVFFGLFAVSAALGAWRLFGRAHAAGADPGTRNHFLFAALVAVVFAYFCVSSFHRAARRSRRP